MEQGLLFDIDRFSTHDGPGIRAAVFLKGCPLSCQWCHSPESQKNRPELVYQQTRCVQCGKCAAICPEKAITVGDGAVIDRERCKNCFACTEICLSHALRVCGFWRGADDVME
ncbi:MAG: 4Fe-4S binding protein, partial [Oscillospiraceae bacterium]|nr:4Fe-4S binding protein [Oscillospiraceae bacterium]